MVHCESEGRGPDPQPAVWDTWLGARMGDGLEFNVVYQQYGHPCHVRLPAALLTSRSSCSNCVCSLRNAPDFASRAHHPSAALWPQLISVPLAFSLVSFVGIVVSSSSETIYGEAVWSPIDLLGKFLDDSPSGATRFGVSLLRRSSGYRSSDHAPS